MKESIKLFGYYQWVRIKRIFSRQIGQYLNWLVTSIITITGLVGSIYSITSKQNLLDTNKEFSDKSEIYNVITAINIAHNSTILILICGIIFFGTLCLIYQSLFSREQIRSKRTENTFKYLHQLAEKIRTFRNENKKNPKKVGEIETFIRSDLFPILTNIFKTRYTVEPKITLKHNVDGQLHCIRSENQTDFKEGLEDSKSHEIFNVFLTNTELFKGLLVENVDLMDKYPIKFIDALKENVNVPDNEKSNAEVFKQSNAAIKIDRIKQRAKGRYKSFIALPIRKSQFENLSGQGLLKKPTIGMLA